MCGLIGRSFNMTEITEVKTGGDATADLICPLMSGQIVPVQMTPGGVVEPGKTRLAPSVVTCAREKCQWWDEFAEQCALGAIAEALKAVHGSVTSVRNVLEPASESPVVRIGDVLGTIDSTLHGILTYCKTLKEKVHPPRPMRGHSRD